jgi:hypothetical protein
MIFILVSFRPGEFAAPLFVALRALISRVPLEVVSFLPSKSVEKKTRRATGVI